MTTQTFTKLKNSTFYNSKTQMLQNSKSDKTKNSNTSIPQKLKMWQNTKSQIVTKLENSKCDFTQKLKLWQNSKTLAMIKLKTQTLKKLRKLNPEKTQFLTKSLLVRTIWYLDNGWDIHGAAFCNLAMFGGVGQPVVVA